MRKLGVVLFCWLLVAVSCSASASVREGFDVSPLDDDTYLFEYWFPDAELGIMLPVNTRTVIFRRDLYYAALVMEDPRLPDSVLAFFTMYNEDIIDLAGQADAEMAVAFISSNAEMLTYTKEMLGNPESTVLRIPEPLEGMYSEHMVALRDGWVLNAMVQHYGGAEELSEEEKAWQRFCMESALASPWTDIEQEYVTADGAIKLAMPESYFVVSVLDGTQETHLNICPVREGILAPVVMCSIGYFPEYVGISIDDVDQGATDALSALSINIPPADVVYEVVELGEYKALSYMQDETRHLMSIKDGWGIHIITMPGNFGYPVKDVERLQDALMRMSLGSEDEALPVMPLEAMMRVGDSLWVPVDKGTLAMNMPEGYYLDVQEDGDGSIFYFENLTDEQQSFQLLLLDTENEIAQMLIGAGGVHEEIGVDDERRRKGIGDYPAILLDGEKNERSSFFILMEKELLMLLFDGSMTEKVMPLLNLRLL